MKNLLPLSVAIVLACATAACNKHTEQTVIYPVDENLGRTMLIQNYTNRPYNYVMYDNLTAFSTNGTPFINRRMVAGEEYTRLLNDEQMRNIYYTDWYSDDYMYARWNHNGGRGPVEYEPDAYNLLVMASIPYTFRIEPGDADSFYYSDLRLRFLKGNKTETHWRVVDIYRQRRNDSSDYASVWNEATPAQRSTQLFVRKNLTARIITDTTVNDNIRFRTVSGPGAVTRFAGPHLDVQLAGIGNATICGRMPMRRTLGIDSAVMFDNTYNTSDPYDYFYVLKRQ